jgi:hypothetical protein
MGKRMKRVLLATYVDDSGDRMEWVLPRVSSSEVSIIQSFLSDRYPGGDVRVSVVSIELLSGFIGGFGGEFETYLAGAWTR